MVWGLEKLWASGSPTPQTTTASPTESQATSHSGAPLVTATVTTSNPNAQSAPQPSSSTPTLSPAVLARIKQESEAHESSDIFSSRSRKQFGLFAAGAAFLLLSSRMTRRQLAKRAVAKPPLFKQNNNNMDISVNGPLEAVEALSIATVNVVSFSMMMTGGLLWAFDISSIHDLRKKIRGGLGVDGTGRDTNQVEEEFEEWIATVLDRKMKKEEAKGVADNEVVKEHWKNEKGKERGI